MSMHKVPLTELERLGLENHRLPIGTPSMSSDNFRNGMAWVLRHQAENQKFKPHEVRELVNSLITLAKDYAHTQQLRSRISTLIIDVLRSKGIGGENPDDASPNRPADSAEIFPLRIEKQ